MLDAIKTALRDVAGKLSDKGIHGRLSRFRVVWSEARGLDVALVTVSFDAHATVQDERYALSELRAAVERAGLAVNFLTA